MEPVVTWAAALLRQLVVRKAAVFLLALGSGMLVTTGLSWAARYLWGVLVELALEMWTAWVAFVWSAYAFIVFYWKGIVRLGKLVVFMQVAITLGLYLSYDFFDTDARASWLVEGLTDGLGWLIGRAVRALNGTAVQEV